MNLLPIGSVIRSNGIDLIITGYHLNEEPETFRLYYIVSFFPIGFIPGQPKSQAFLPAEKEDIEVIFRGYLDSCGEKHLERLSKRAETLRGKEPKKMYAFLELLQKKMEEMDHA